METSSLGEGGVERGAAVGGGRARRGWGGQVGVVVGKRSAVRSLEGGVYAGPLGPVVWAAGRRSAAEIGLVAARWCSLLAADALLD
jgi:hypothetical protein